MQRRVAERVADVLPREKESFVEKPAGSSEKIENTNQKPKSAQRRAAERVAEELLRETENCVERLAESSEGTENPRKLNEKNSK